MYLKRIELRGFKSFAEPVEIEFQRGINAIVGPNGSGKSNIVDAIRWVLGEQSMRSLRSAKLGDIIFNGSDLKKPVGMAEVAVTLDNSDHLLPVDFSEICFTRRVFRSGESEFFMNKTPCRLKDIQEILMDTGIGKDGYSVIGQGTIEEILTSRPEERRYIFEETAGIMKYRARKREAERRLEETMVNITRIDDILSEIQNQLTPLAHQREKALEYQRLSEKCKELDVNLRLFELEKREKDLLETQEIANKVLDKLQTAKDELESLEQMIATDKRELDIKEIEQEAVQKELYAVEGSVKETEKELNWNRGELAKLAKEIQSIETTLGELKEKIHSTTQGLKDNISRLEEKLKEINHIEIDIEKEQKELVSLDEAISQKETFIEGLKVDVLDLLNFVSEKRNAISRLTAMKSNFEERKKQIERELSSQREVKTNIEVEIQKNKEQTQLLEKEISKLEADLGQAAKTLSNKKKHYEKNRMDYEAIWQELSAVTSKYKTLQEIRDNFEGYQHGVRNLLSALKKQSFQCSGIYGTVADLLSVEKEYEVAIETALGSALQNIVCRSESDAKAAVEFLKENRLGRVTFLPLDAIKRRELTNSEKQILSKQGCIGVADRLVSFEDKYYPAISNLLGRVLIAETMDDALQIARQTSYSLKVVTLDGQLLNPGGSITGGSRQKSMPFLARNRQLLELEKKQAELNRRLSWLKEKNASMLKEIEQYQRDLETSKSRLYELKSQRDHLQRQLEEKLGLLEESKNRIRALETEVSLIEEKDKKAGEEIFVIESEIGELDCQSIDHQNRAEKLQKELMQDRAHREAISQKITDLKVCLASKRQEYLNLKQAVEYSQYNLEKDQHETKSLEEKLSEHLMRRTLLEKSLEVNIAKVEKFKTRLLDLRQRLEMLKGERIDLKQRIEDAQGQMQRIYDEQSKLERKAHQIQVKAATLQVEVRQILDMLYENYSLTLEEAKELKKDLGEEEELRHRLEIYRNQMNSLGTVNLQAIEDYDNLKNRYDFLQAQKTDMLEAKDNLDKLIEDMVKIMEKMFLESFYAVRQEFSKVFCELFGGGRADLAIVGEGSILESGIDIIAQPPGKKLQNHSLLSGGERALTAIALLFAILNTKPTPFCILDEIEASLDDANIERFSNYLKKVSEHTQFIVVTHRKTTMEVADALYGISMENTAVSRVLSIKMDK